MIRKSCYFAFLAVFIFLFPIVALSGDDSASVNISAGKVEQSEEGASAFNLLRDVRLLDIEAEYSARLQAVLKKIEAEPDPMEKERLQKEVALIKAEQEKAQMEANLQIAIEKGDEDRMMQLQEGLFMLHNPKKGETSLQELRPAPDPRGKRAKARLKNPDDAE